MSSNQDEAVPQNQLTVALIGASGFVGFGILNHFLDNRDNVIRSLKDAAAVSNSETLTIRCGSCGTTVEKLRARIEGGESDRADDHGVVLEYVVCDVRDRSSVEIALRGASFVINASGLYKWHHVPEQDFYDVNETGAENVLDVCWAMAEERNDGDSPLVLIHLSTALAYGSELPRKVGNAGEQRHDDDSFAEKDDVFVESDASNIAYERDNFCSSYAFTKALGDQRIRARYERLFAESSGNSSACCLRTRILPLACVLGAGDTYNLAQGRPGAVQRDFVLGKIPALVAPETEFIYVDVDDVGRAVSRALLYRNDNDEKGDRFSEFLIGNYKDRMTTKVYFQRMEKWNKHFADEDAAKFGATQFRDQVKKARGKHANTLLPQKAAKCPTRTVPISLLSGIAWVCGGLGYGDRLPPGIVEQAKRGAVLFSCRKADECLGMSEYKPVDESVKWGMWTAREKIAKETGVLLFGKEEQ